MPKRFRRVRLSWYWPDDWVAAQEGRLLDGRHYKRPVTAADGDLDFIRPEGTLLAAFRPHALPEWACRLALPRR